MFIEQFYSSGLNEAAYYIESGGEAAIIDPLRETDAYLQLAATRKAKIKYVFETHFHADFVSGHLDIARLTGARIIYGPDAKTDFIIYSARDEESFQLGDLTLQVLSTPGHTSESVSILLLDDREQPRAIFTGDTLLLNDIGRPDAQNSNITKEDLASQQYNSIRQKIMTLPDEVLVFPGHGKDGYLENNSDRFSTIGEQKLTNPFLKINDKNRFIAMLLAGYDEPPGFYKVRMGLNQKGYETIKEICERTHKYLSREEVDKILRRGGLILDSRNGENFAAKHITGSINIGLDGPFGRWAARLLHPEKEVVLVANQGKERELILQLADIGITKIAGIVDGGIAGWENQGGPISSIFQINADTLSNTLPDNAVLLDVREKNEMGLGALNLTFHIPLQNLEAKENLLDNEKDIYICCLDGYKSMIAASILKKKGYKKVTNITGGVLKASSSGIKLHYKFANSNTR